MSDELNSVKIFEQITERIASNPSLADVDAIYQFNISGDPGGNWTVNLKGTHEVTTGEAENADCTISIDDADFVALTTGKLNPQMAFMQGKVKVQGNVGLALKLEKILKG